MHQFSFNFVHFMHGMTLMFFIFMSIRLYYRKRNNRLLTFLFWETLFWLFIQLKDFLNLIDGINIVRYLSDIRLSLDTWCVPVTLLLLIEAARPHKINLKKTALLMVPTVVLTTVFVITSLKIFLHISLAYSVLLGVATSVACVMACVIKNDNNFINKYLAQRDDAIYIKQISRVALLLIFLFAVWKIIVFTSHFSTGSILYMFQLVIWGTVYYLSERHFVEKKLRNPQTDYTALEASLLRCMNDERLFLNPKLSIKDVAFQIKSNRTYISTYLNKHLKTTFPEYVNNFRVKEACNILNSHEYSSLEEVAEKAGFNSSSTFYRAFSKAMNMTPLQYKAKSQLL